MTDLQFDDQNNFHYKSREILGDYKKPGMMSWLQDKGIVKDEKTAQYVLFGVIVVCIGLAAGVLFYSGILGSTKQEPLTSKQLQNLPAPIREAYLKRQNEK